MITGNDFLVSAAILNFKELLMSCLTFARVRMSMTNNAGMTSDSVKRVWRKRSGVVSYQPANQGGDRLQLRGRILLVITALIRSGIETRSGET